MNQLQGTVSTQQFHITGSPVRQYQYHGQHTPVKPQHCPYWTATTHLWAVADGLRTPFLELIECERQCCCSEASSE